jgi:hypothetical protein
MFQDAIVPEPPIVSTLTVNVVVVYAVTRPSIKLLGDAELATITLEPTTYALVPCAWFTVNALDPVPIAKDVVDVNPA